MDTVLEGGVFSSLSEENPMDLNQASIEELKQLRGVGDVMAKRIIAGRPYVKIEDLLKTNGIGAKTLEKIQPYVKVE